MVNLRIDKYINPMDLLDVSYLQSKALGVSTFLVKFDRLISLHGRKGEEERQTVRFQVLGRSFMGT